MNESRRKPRKLIRVREAADILDESRRSVLDRVYRGELQSVAGEKLTSPRRVYRTEVITLAQQLGRM